MKPIKFHARNSRRSIERNPGEFARGNPKKKTIIREFTGAATTDIIENSLKEIPGKTSAEVSQRKIVGKLPRKTKNH